MSNIKPFFLRMSLLAILIGLPVTAAYSQLSISMKNKTVAEVIRQIERISDYRFFYSKDLPGLTTRITVEATNSSIESILDQITQQAPVSYTLREKKQIVLSSSANRSIKPSGSTKTISGTVVDEKNEPVIGANVSIKGTTTGAITDLDGKFILDTGPGAELQISYVGYQTVTVKVGNQSVVNIKIQEDSQALSEVVVIGYGTVKRKDFTGSVASVKLENSPIAQAPNVNMLESLKGNVSGLNIGASNTAGEGPSMEIRGQNSIGKSNNPLIVLDGMIYLGSIRDIHPNDIASVDVLKDATSAAAYGSRAANGVIAITTKRGTSDKPVITFNANAGLRTWQNRPEVMNAEQWMSSVNGRNGYEPGSTNWLKKGELMNMDRNHTTNWLDFATRTGSFQDYQVAISGSAKRLNYYVSTGFTKDEGIVRGDDFNKKSILGKIKSNITDWLEVGIDAAYAQSDYSGNAANLGEAYTMSPYGVAYRDEAKKLLEKYPYGMSAGNPLWGVNDGTRDNLDIRDNYRLTGTALVKLPWIKGLSYRFNYSTNWELSTQKSFIYESNYVKEGEYDDLSRYAPATIQGYLVNANGNVIFNKISSYVMDNIINYTNTFGKHGIDVTLVATRDSRKYEQVKTTGSDYALNGNTALGYNGLHKASVQKTEQNNNLRRNIGYLARASYTFDGKYYINASIRRDGASIFGANSKWGNFGAVGVAWNITKESFMANLTYLNNLKLKASWGQNGNQGLDPYATLSTIANGQSGGSRLEFSDTGSKIYYGLYQKALGNRMLGWESTEALNIGIESSWLQDRLGFDLDVYSSKTTNQLFTRSIPVMSGFKTIQTSMGQVNNWGIEATVHGSVIQTKDWHWSSSLNFWINRNKLVKLYGEDMNGDGVEDDDIGNSLFIGKSLKAIYGYQQIGIVQEEDKEYMKQTGTTPGMPKYADLTGEGTITAEDRTILGYEKEGFKMGWSNNVSWKGFDLYVMVTGTFGGNGYYQKSNTGAYVSRTGRFNDNGIYIDHWTPENRSNIYPAITFNSDGGRFLGLQNRAFVRIQDVTLSYTFKGTWIEKARIKNLKLFCSAKNLATFTSWEGGDPETGAGVRANTKPVPSTYSLGVNLSF